MLPWGSDLVVAEPPTADLGAGFVQAPDPLLVEALVSELAVEAFDIAVLHGPPRLDQDVLDAMFLRPSDAGSAGELRTVVRPNCCQIAKPLARVGDLDELGAERPAQHTGHRWVAVAVSA